MAREVLAVISDDLDGSPHAESVEFALDAVSYSIDLVSKYEKTLRTALARTSRSLRRSAPRAEGRGHA